MTIKCLVAPLCAISLRKDWLCLKRCICRDVIHVINVTFWTELVFRCFRTIFAQQSAHYRVRDAQNHSTPIDCAIIDGDAEVSIERSSVMTVEYLSSPSVGNSVLIHLSRLSFLCVAMCASSGSRQLWAKNARISWFRCPQIVESNHLNTCDENTLHRNTYKQLSSLQLSGMPYSYSPTCDFYYPRI